MSDIKFVSWKSASGYQFDKNDCLQMIETITNQGADYISIHQVVSPDVFKEFIAILEPIHHSGISDNLKLYCTDKTHCEFREDIYVEVKRAILKFANKNGFSNMFDSVTTIDREEVKFFLDDVEHREPTVDNIIEEAWELWGYIKSNTRYIEEVEARLNTMYKLEVRVDMKTESTFFYTNDVMGSIWWSWFYSNIDYEVKECKWCSVPLLQDRRASFCSPPRQCKNNYHNLQARMNKIKEKKNASKKSK